MTISEELSRRWFLRLLGGGALTVSVGGCGGAGEGGGDTGSGFGGDPLTLTLEAHTAADMATNQQAVADFLRTGSEVTSSCVADGVA